MTKPPPLPPLIPEPNPEQPAEEQLPDWLKDLSGEESIPSPQEQEPLSPDQAAPQEEVEIIPEEESVLIPEPEGSVPENVGVDQVPESLTQVPEPATQPPVSVLQAPEPDAQSVESVLLTPESDTQSHEPVIQAAELVALSAKSETSSESSSLPEQLEEKAELVPESSDPFAGIEGVLPLPASSPDIAKPITYPTKLSFSEEQLTYIAVMERLNRAEKEPQSMAQPTNNQRSPLIRLIFLIILLIALLLPLVFGIPKVSPPSISADVDSVWQKIEALPANSAVIVAVDYDPASSAELEMASSAVIDHLLVHQAHLFLISTSPMGPLLANRLVDIVSSSRQGVEVINPQVDTVNSQVTNLGYLPGGSVGLASFARDLGQTMPGPFQPLRTAEIATPAKAVQIDSLKDVAMLLVLTESPDTARMWIEQVQPYLRWQPMLMILSAQAEPVIQTYAEGTGAPVQGMVVGVAGGAAYERITGQANSDLTAFTAYATNSWSAYVIGAWTIAILIILSGTYHLVRAKAERDRQEREEGS
jgi:hypothetical protein